MRLRRLALFLVASVIAVAAIAFIVFTRGAARVLESGRPPEIVVVDD